MSKDFTSLKSMREGWVEATSKNGFKIRQVLTENYPDNAHFIYELLQNAEDTQASEVCFTLNNERLDFEHNGLRLFSLKDIESITGIGVSSKLDDPTSIGKFGVGFKAAFVYTNTPEIYSGDYHFKIHDLVVPEVIGPQQRTEKTQFIFPFDRPEKSTTQAEEEIARGLRELGDNTLLFLKHIHKIKYQLADNQIETIERIEHKDGRIEICSIQSKKKKTSSYWLRFEKDVKVNDEDEKQKDCRIAIAYCLVKEERKKKQSKWKIVPLDRGEVSIYFPAKKEASNLRFHIHAPFASTVARDSVRDCQANKDLRDHLAKLVVESLETIRDRKMLDVSFLAVLPNHDENLLEFYQPIREAIVEAFCKTDFTPTRSGHNRAAQTLYRGPAKIAEVIGDEGLSILTEFSAPLWAANAPQENQREDRFIHSLKINEWGWSKLVSIFEQPYPYAWDENEKTENAKHQERIKTFIYNLSDAELMRFYALLGEAVDAYHKSVDIKGLPIVRVTSDGVDQHVTPEEAYLPSEAETLSPSDVFFVKPEVYSSGRSDSQKGYSKLFLDTIGVRAYDEKVGIERLLKLYEGEHSISQKMHLKHLRQFVTFWKKYPDGRTVFKYVPFLQGVTKNDQHQWFPPNKLCLDTPYLETGLTELIFIHNNFALMGGYKNFLNEVQLKDFVAFLKDIGVMHRLHISKQSTWIRGRREKLHHDYRFGAREGRNKIDDDYTIEKIDEYLNAKSIPASRLLWNALLETTEKCASAQYAPNSKYPPRHDDSWLVIQLRENAWIPDKFGKFYSPQEMTQDGLRTDFPFDDRNGLLTAIGFGEEVVKQSEAYRQKQIAAKELGFDSLEELEELKQLKDTGLNVKEFLAKHTTKVFPDSLSPNPERRSSKVSDNARNTSEKIKETKNRAVDPEYGEAQGVAKEYLELLYTDKDNEMFCQLCQAPQPVVLDGKPYFEAVDCVAGINSHHAENKLALCPNHAAMYKNGHLKSEDVQYLISECNGQKILLSLAGNKVELRFNIQHLQDLKSVLAALGSEEI